MTVLLFGILIACPILIQHKWDDHEYLHEESPTDTQYFISFDVHDPTGDHGASCY